ncbi:MAG: hypothetical protein ABSG73_15530 [Candidatus Aminicenantales bacterium]
MTIFKIRHPIAGARACVFGCDFFDGVGSTSDMSQVCDLLDLGGYKIIGPLSEDDKQDLLRFRKQRQPFKDAQKALVKPLPKRGDWSALP